MGDTAIKGLLIEEDPNDATRFLEYMKSPECASARLDFSHANSLKRGLELLSLGGIDVVLLDINLPDGHGIETVQRLRAVFPEVPVVVLTGLADEAVGIEALRIGAQDYQVKGSVNCHTLKRTISVAIERQRMLLELRRVDQLKAEIKERKALDKLKDELLSAVSHEMRNPLAVIKVVAGNLRGALQGTLSAQQGSLIEMQQRNIARLEKIVSRLLDLSRLESGKAQIVPVRIDAAQLTGEIVEGFRVLGLKPRVDIVVEIPPDLAPVYSDPDLFVQLLNNLVDNALRYARSRVVLRAEIDEGAPGQFVRFSVSDDGEGIPRDRIGDLFNKFVQVNRCRNGAGYKGTGLGLSICKEIVERQGGRIWVDSAVGLGSAFRFTLPALSQSHARDGVITRSS